MYARDASSCYPGPRVDGAHNVLQGRSRISLADSPRTACERSLKLTKSVHLCKTSASMLLRTPLLDDICGTSDAIWVIALQLKRSHTI